MEVLKGEQSIWNDRGLLLKPNASHCFLLVLFHLATQLIFFFLFHLKDFSYTEQILHDLLM